MAVQDRIEELQAAIEKAEAAKRQVEGCNAELGSKLQVKWVGYS